MINADIGLIAMNATTMTVRVPVDLHDKIVRLAQGTHRGRSFLAAEAVTAYVERELSIIDGMQQGLADVPADRTVAHDATMGEIDAAPAKAAA